MSEPEIPIRQMLSRAGVKASDTDISMVTAIAGAATPRISPRLDTEPQLVQRPGRWEQE